MMTLEEHGPRDGRPLLLLNPFPLDARVWVASVAPLAAAGCRVLTTDYPGMGPLGGDGGAAPRSPSLSIDGIADEALAALRQRGIDRPIVLGISMGGYVALSLAVRVPTVLAALILVDTRAGADSPAARQGRATALSTLAEGNPGGAVTARGVEAYLASSLPKLLALHASPSHLSLLQRLAVRDGGVLAAGIAALRDRPDRMGALATLAVPTLVLGGGDDQIVPPEEMRQLADAITGARFAEIPGAGHLPPIEQPAAFCQHVGDFVKGLSS